MEREYPYRAELRCHSVHSPMSGVATAREIFEEASKLETSAIAITDTDNVNAYSAVDWLVNKNCSNS